MLLNDEHERPRRPRLARVPARCSFEFALGGVFAKLAFAIPNSMNCLPVRAAIPSRSEGSFYPKASSPMRCSPGTASACRASNQ